MTAMDKATHDAWIRMGRADRRFNRLYGHSLPPRDGSPVRPLIRALYRAGWALEEGAELPAQIGTGQTGTPYCVVLISRDRPVFNVVPPGFKPSGGYFSLTALLELKGDTLK